MACEWDTNENADGEFTPQACTAPQRTMLTEAVRPRFKWQTELTELYVCMSFCLCVYDTHGRSSS